MLRASISCLLFCAITLHAQSPQASVSGTVSDPARAMVPGVEVLATNIATGQAFRGETNDTGFYSIQSLPIGQYKVSAQKEGFRRAVRESLTLNTGQNLELDIVLEVGSVNESVTVSAQTTLLETRTSDTSQLVETKNLEDMPLGDRRTMNIVRITGAAVFVNYDSGGKPNFS